ncbi:MAG TPA: aldolase/citrate lyase family protein [Acidimicrobiales bacterium]|nr:aldolase/citrate lyase family protein [Acidimicrobiales bacterium]
MGSLREMWASGQSTLGAWLSLREPYLAEAAGNAGYDYVCIDMQHGLADYQDVTGLLHALAGTPTVPIVRVPWNEQGIIGRVLDAGAMGVIIPMVNSPEEARRAVAACRYAPDGARSFGPLVAAARHGADYASTANETVACIPMIETRQAVETVDDILAVPGIDAVYVGPADLSLTYGLPPAGDNPGEPFDGALATVVAACERHGVVPGIHASPSLTAKRLESGFRMVTVTNDAAPAVQGLRSALTEARQQTQVDSGSSSPY